MKKIKTTLLCVVLLPLLMSAGITIDGATTSQTNDDTVYICTGPQSKRFHCTPKCRGLGSCSKKVIAVSVKKASSMGRTPCGWCYD